ADMTDSKQPPVQQLAQPWKAWFKPESDTDFNPLDKPISLALGGQGIFPQKPRQVDLSKEKPCLADVKGNVL
ncbi:MAG: hypothetical protein Q9172_001710, partial [Xanthocarpia lactea]